MVQRVSPVRGLYALGSSTTIAIPSCVCVCVCMAIVLTVSDSEVLYSEYDKILFWWGISVAG